MIKKRSIEIAGHRTSLSLEEAYWTSLRELADEDGLSLAALVAQIDERRLEEGLPNLSSAVRLYVLAALRAKAGLPPLED